jgi:Phage portal protein
VPAAPAPTARAAAGDRLALLLSTAQLSRVTRHVGLTVPALRAAHGIVTKKPATWQLRAWQGDYLAQTQPAWLANPDPRLTWFELCALTLDHGVWHDRAYWHVTRRGADGYPLAFELIDPQRVTDDERGMWVDGKPADALDGPAPVILSDGRILESLIPIRWQGLGGLGRAGSVIVTLALNLLSAASRYADSPLPQAAIRSTSGAKLKDTEITALLDGWDLARASRTTAYLESAELETFGWSAKELQLVEAREHVALEIARALSIPAAAVDASGGDSMTYANVVDRRRDLVEALRSWIAPIEQALSLHAAPRGTDIRYDVTAFLRDDPVTRMSIWASGIASGVLTVPEARAQEPLAIDERGTP